MLDLMFAAALSGMRAAEAAEQQLTPIDYKLPAGTQEKLRERDWRTWVGSDFNSFTDDRDCPIFFEKQLPGFGAVSVRSRCTEDTEE